MSSYPKHHTNRLHLLAIARWVVITAFSECGWVKLRLFEESVKFLWFGEKSAGAKSRRLVLQNNVLEAQIGVLTSRTALQRRLDEGFIKLVPISTQSIVHVRPPDPNHRQTAGRDSDNEFQTVSRDGFARP